MPENRPATPALDFLAFIQGRAETPGYENMLDDRDATRISRILTDYDERAARSQLLRMQAHLTNRAWLEPGDMARLEAITGTGPDVQLRKPFGWWLLPVRTRVVLAGVAVLGVLLAVIFGIIVPWVHSANGGGNPPPGAAPQVPPAQQVAPAYSDLTLLKQNWGPWQQLAPSDSAPQTGAPALLLVDHGGFYASKSWTVSPLARGWAQDLGGNLGSVNVRGDFIDFTDANGAPGIVRVNQAFVVGSNPSVVLRIDGTGTVYSMSQAQAIAVRSPLK